MAAADGVEVDTFLVAKVRRAPPLKGRGDPPIEGVPRRGVGMPQGGGGSIPGVGGGRLPPRAGGDYPDGGGTPRKIPGEPKPETRIPSFPGIACGDMRPPALHSLLNS